MPDTSLIATGGTAAALGLVFAIASWKSQRDHNAWTRDKTRARGVVSRIGLRGHLSRNKPTFDDGGLAVPVVRFTAENGADYEIDAGDAPHRVGAEVEVAYDPALPSDGRMVARTPKIGCAAVLLAIGVALVIAGLFR